MSSIVSNNWLATSKSSAFTAERACLVAELEQIQRRIEVKYRQRDTTLQCYDANIRALQEQAEILHYKIRKLDDKGRKDD